MTSAELVQAGDPDTVFVRRVRMFEEIAATISTDSLARLYVAAMDDSLEQGAVYQQAVACQFRRMLRQYGAVATKLAIDRMEDSVLTAPELRRRWVHTQERWPMFGTVPGDDKCDLRGVPRRPDSLNNQPLKTVWHQE